MQNSAVVDRYVNNVTELYSMCHSNIDKESIRRIVNDNVYNSIKDIPCVMHNNIRHETIETSVLGAIEWIEQHNPIISGNATLFKQHREYLSPNIKMLEHLQKKRKVVKNKMLSFPKGTPGYINNYNSQINIKVIMNAEYGGSGTVHSPFYSQYIPPSTTSTAKCITTTLICCLEFLSGNKDPWAMCSNINELMDVILIVLRDDEDRDLIEDHYTSNEVLEWLSSRCANITLEDKSVLKSILDSMDNYKLTKLMLAFNIHLVLQKYLTADVDRVMSYLKSHKLRYDDMTDEKLFISGFGTKMPDDIKDDMLRISKVVCDNCVYRYLPNDNEVRAFNMKRMIVCVTDTDSLMVHFAHYLDSFRARTDNFRDSCVLALAFGSRLFIENIIPKYVGYIAEAMKIEDKNYRDKFVFKNEFGFLAMALFKKKMYAASMFVQEGKPRDIHHIEATGLSFKKRDSAKFLEPLMLEMYDKYILTGEKIDVEKILSIFYEWRHKLLNEVNMSTEYHKVMTTKDPKVYKKTLPAQVKGSIVWSNIKPDEKIEPLDRVVVLTLSWEKLETFKDTDSRIMDILLENVKLNPMKKTSPVICIPEHYKDIPDWISKVIDTEGVVDKILSPFKQILGLFDVYMADTENGMIPSRMILL